MSQATKPHRFDPHKLSPTPSGSHSLTRSQRDAMQQELDSFQQLHHQVCASVADARDLISSLDSAATEVERYLTLRRSYLGTVRHIPFEILGHIFQAYIDDNREHLGARGWLQLVCTKWRAVVLGHPNLWTRVDVVGPFDASTVDSYLNHIDLCVLRSGARKLDISFAIDSNNTPLGTLTRTQILNHLISHANGRWKSFKYYQAPECVVICQHHQLIELSRFGHVEKWGPPLHNLKSLRTLQIPLHSWSIFANDRAFPQVTELVVDGYRWFDPNFKKSESDQSWLRVFPSLRSLSIRLATQILDSVSLEEEEVPSQDVYQPRSLTHLILHGPVPLHALKRVQFLALQEVVIQPNDDGAHLFQQCSEQYPFDFGSLPVLRLECQPGTLFWHLGEQYEDFCLFRDEIIPSAFGKFQDAETVSASGCIWRSFAWIFDAWDLEFATGANKGCDETHSISMVRVRATMNNKTIGNGENWMPPSESDGDYERNSDW